ncbi:cyclase family protein [Fuchsiella alkaliacetigena]|uniref:cyclase family protein n=1 Tax=Fuchsiella alkaliacetigena TaxID=957042 RepID=UPI00200A7139|nr:cyclase family protein [Fuchsiella alkaliacetigena]MCK8825622.1 cyclase family protein [Fuchsiella alkaliacetigena]
MKLYDLTQPLSTSTPPWPTYEPLEVKYFKRLSTERVNGQLISTSNHVGTHLDGERHFWTAGRDIASVPLEELVGPGVVVDLSDAVGEYGIYTSEMIEERVEVKQGDILIIHTGYHHYAYNKEEADEEAYMCKHPGPNMEFAEWCKEKEIKWIGVDCGSADHPMNTVIRKLRPDLAEECEEKLGQPLTEIFPDEGRQLMHTKLFPEGIIHVENLGGEIDKILNQRIAIGCFPWRFVDGESSICRVVAFEGMEALF